MFILADAAATDRRRQKTPDGHYNGKPAIRCVLVDKKAVLWRGTRMQMRDVTGEEMQRE
jgi:hypothetical protein